MRLAANALSNAGMKCSIRTLSKGGISNGVVQVPSSGLLSAAVAFFAAALPFATTAALPLAMSGTPAHAIRSAGI